MGLLKEAPKKQTTVPRNTSNKTGPCITAYKQEMATIGKLPRKLTSEKVKLVKREEKSKTNPYAGKVTVADKTGKNQYFHSDYFTTVKISIDGEIPAQEQRKEYKIRGNVNTLFQKTSLRNLLLQQFPAGFKKFCGPVLAKVTFHYKIPNNNPENIQKLDFCTDKPDIDNLQKFLFDAFDNVFYEKNTQVVSVTVAKIYDDHDHVEIFIAEEKKEYEWNRGACVMVTESDSDNDITTEADEFFSSL
jgi:Holliday junction resolvase RusA-like endonuclease